MIQDRHKYIYKLIILTSLNDTEAMSIMEIEYEVLETILKQQQERSKIWAFACASKETYKLYKHCITDVIAPTKYTLIRAIKYGGATDTAMFSLINQLKRHEVGCNCCGLCVCDSPLCCAVKYNSSMNVINYIIKKYKFLTCVRDQYGEMPIHIVVGRPSSKRYTDNMEHATKQDQKIVQTLTALLEADPDSIYALRIDPEIFFLILRKKLMLRKKKIGPSNKLVDQMTPLQVAIYKHACLDVIQTFITYDPVIVQRFDIWTIWNLNDPSPCRENHPGYIECVSCSFRPIAHAYVLPVHLAAYYNSEFEIVKLLIESFPESIKIKDSIFLRTPLHWALYGHYTNGVLPTNDQKNINTIAFSLNNSLLPSNDVVYIKTIAYLLKTCPIVTTFVDVGGVLPVELEIRRHEEQSENHQKYVNPIILITLMRMYLNHTYPDANGNVNWEANTIEIEKNIQLHLTTELHQIEKAKVLRVIQEIELLEENIKSSTEQVIIRFVELTILSRRRMNQTANEPDSELQSIDDL